MANQVSNFNAVGVKEDLENMIYKVFADDTPFTGLAGSEKVSQPYHEYQTVDLETVNPENAAIDGAVAVNDAPRLSTRVGSRTQTFSKVGEVTGILEASDEAGRDSEYNFQKKLAGEEIVRDIEAALVGNRSSAVGNATVARKAAGFEAWLTTNTVRNVAGGGASGGFSGGNTTAATDANATVTFTEAMLKAGMLAAYQAGGKPSVALMGAGLKQTFSTFSGNALNRIDNGSKPVKGITISGAAEVYLSDFGSLQLTPAQYTNSRSCLLIDPRFVAIGTLRPIKENPLANVGDSRRFQLVGDKTVIVKSEKEAHAVIADIKAQA